MSPIVQSSVPTTAASAIRVFELSLSQMLWSRRSLFLMLIVGAPVFLALAIRLAASLNMTAMVQVNGVRIGGPSLFGIIIWLVYVRFVVPVLGIFYGTALIADEVEDKTITYLFTRAVPRRAILLGKYLAYIVCTVLLVLPSVVVVYFLIIPLINGGGIGAAFPNLLADLGVLMAGLAVYGAVFALVGALVKRPLVIGLVFAFGWEPATLLFPGYLRRLTVGYYLQGLVPHAIPQDSTLSALMQLFAEVPSLGVAIGSLVLLTVVTLWWAGETVEAREYVLEQ